MKSFWLTCSSAIILALPVQAQVMADVSSIPVEANICEQLAAGESRSSARIRATDKASFKAVEDLPELRRFKDGLSGNQFNTQVYKLVDNFLENLQTLATEQTDERVCVKVSANLPLSAIEEVFSVTPTDEPIKSNDKWSLRPEDKMFMPEDNWSLDLESEIPENISITIPPKPDIVINKNIAYDSEVGSEVVAETAPLTTTPEIVTSQASAPTITVSKTAENNNQTKVLVADTEFYNGQTTAGFFAPLEQALKTKPGIKVIATADDPDYILKTKVLKARVDKLNSETSRLQIVVAVELTDTNTGRTETDHQNRFVLFASNDDAQKTAAGLTKRLLLAGLEPLLNKIKTPSTSIITPN